MRGPTRAGKAKKADYDKKAAAYETKRDAVYEATDDLAAATRTARSSSARHSDRNATSVRADPAACARRRLRDDLTRPPHVTHLDACIRLRLAERVQNPAHELGTFRLQVQTRPLGSGTRRLAHNAPVARSRLVRIGIARRAGPTDGGYGLNRCRAGGWGLRARSPTASAHPRRRVRSISARSGSG